MEKTINRQYLRHIFLLVSIMALTAAVYWPGLDGPLHFDDLANLAPIQSWQDGELAWQDVVLGNRSGVLGRPVSMLSFLFTASVGTDFAWQLKFHNLLLHLCIGLLVFLLALSMARRQNESIERAARMALAVAAIWLLHPMFVSTVLYAVQRMAMLSALFMFAAMLAYFQGRLCLERGQRRHGTLLILLVVPVLTLLAAFSKENGLLAFLLCGIIEWVYFHPERGRRRPTAVQIFLVGAVYLPLASALIMLILTPDFFLSGYQNRHFTVVERLLTQSRVLLDYAGGLLLPQAPSFSLYRDDFSISTGLITPWTTVVSLAGWLLTVGFAVALRKRIPGFAAGIGIFLVGHAMESGIFPLLIYFEHRNYLPGFGLFWAIASLVMFFVPRVSVRMDNPVLLMRFAILGLALVLAGSTISRSLVWRSADSIVEQSLKHYPDSRFARMEMANLLMNRTPPETELARSHYEHLRQLPRLSTRFIGSLGLIAVDCFSDQVVDGSDVERTFITQLESIEADVLKALLSLSDIVTSQPCNGLSAKEFASHIEGLLDSVHLPPNTKSIWRLRFRAARLYHHDGLFSEALEQAELAWDTGSAELPVGMFIVALRINLGQHDQAETLLQELQHRISSTDQQGQNLLKQFRSALN